MRQLNPNWNFDRYFSPILGNGKSCLHPIFVFCLMLLIIRIIRRKAQRQLLVIAGIFFEDNEGCLHQWLEKV